MKTSFKDQNIFDQQINSFWITKLYTEFEKQNLLVKKHLWHSLKKPNFSITTDQTKWGLWEPESRTITFQLQLLRNFEWQAVIHTLKHEMAHMIVDEIFSRQQIHDSGRQHGELFRKACKIMDVDHRASHNLEAKNNLVQPHRNKLAVKISKLMALGESPNKEEAENALSKAHELMVRYNISMLELSDDKRIFTSRPVGREWKKVPTYIKTLGQIIHEYYFVNHIFCYATKGKYIELFGEPQNLDIAEYIFHFLLLEGEHQWEIFKKTKKREDTSRKYSKGAFIDGLYEGFADTLKKRDARIMDKVDSTNTLPIGTNDPLLREKYLQAYPDLKTWHSTVGYSNSGKKDGRDAGRNITIRQGVKSSRTSSRGLLNK